MNKTIISGKEKKDLNTLIDIADIASTLRLQGTEVEKQLNIDNFIDEVKGKVLEAAKIKGEDITEEQAEAATRNYLSNLYTFKQPKNNISYKIAEAYVDRKRIARNYGIPAAAVLSIAFLTFGGISLTRAAHQKALEKKVENRVLNAYQDKKDLEVKIGELSESDVKKIISEKEYALLNGIVDNTSSRLDNLDPFFVKFCDDGTPGDDINKINYKEAEQQLVAVNTNLAGIRGEVNRGFSVVEAQRRILYTRQNLDSLIEEIRNIKPEEVFLKKAETFYTNGINYLNNKKINEAESYKNQLENVKADIGNFSELQEELIKIYADIKTISKDEEAIRKGDKLYREARNYINNADLDGLSNRVESLEDIDRVLNLDYTVRVVNREGVNSGMDRYYTDENGTRASGFYLIVEAIDSDGMALDLDITNKEDGRTYKVDMWGEMVPERVFERIRKDKADGIIEDDVVAKKEKGYLDATYVMKGVTKKWQITRW